MLELSNSTTFDLTNTVAAVTTVTFLFCSFVSIVLGIAIGFSFSLKEKKSKGYIMTLAILPVIVQVVIMLVNGNIGTGVAVMGAFSLVRFRSAPGTAKDICAIFLSMAVGLATGTGHIAVAVILTAVVCLFCIVYTVSPLGEGKSLTRELTVTIPETLDYTGVFDEILDKYTKSWELVSVKTTNMGSLFKLKYDIQIKDGKSEKQLIDELRCRNGNLEIMCARAAVLPEQL